ncbi:unnamed protein product [Symbiodinium sp. CCMP2592]|nr:unnamed protein product [Symbiodinium sp. CCMP2592]
MCPLIAYPYLVSLFAYAVMIASAVLMIVGWMATVCTDDSSCVFRAALAGYWFSNLGASIFAAFVVQTLHFHIGEGDESLLLSVIGTNAYTTLVFEAPMAIVQHVSCIRRRGALFVTSSGMLGIMWSGAAFAMASDPKMGTLYGAHPLVVAAFSFLLELAKKMVMRQLRRWWCGFEPSKQLDLELGLCLRAISSPVPEDNHAPPPRPALRRSNLRFLTGDFGKLTLSRKSSLPSSRPSTDDSTSPCAETFESERPEKEREPETEGAV